MRGTVVKALRVEAAHQDRPLRHLKREFMKLNHRQRGGMRARLAVFRAMRERFSSMPA